MRTPQKHGDKGSLKWIQTLVNENRGLFNSKVQGFIKDDLSLVEWVSPRKEDDNAEYRDNDFLKILGLEEHQSKLLDFWPKGGPQWDALGKLENKYHFIVEAKANIPEISSSCMASSEKSKTKIKNSINCTKQFLNATSGKNWLNGFYQYANRMCHLYFLREVCGINAYLIFVYFCNDSTHISTSIEQWDGALKLQQHLMSLNSHKLKRYVIDLFIDTEEINFEHAG